MEDIPGHPHFARVSRNCPTMLTGLVSDDQLRQLAQSPQILQSHQFGHKAGNPNKLTLLGSVSGSAGVASNSDDRTVLIFPAIW